MIKFKQSEAEVKRAVFEYLEMRGYFWWPTNTVGVYDPIKKLHRRPPKWFKAGVPDANLIKDGVYYALELKSTTGKQSKEQEEFELKVDLNGGRYYIIRSVADLIDIGL